MSTKLEQGKAAKIRYAELRYSHVETDPNNPTILTADPWSYLSSHLQQKVAQTKGDNRKQYEKALYYTRLAEDFQYAADSVELPSKGTLVYYSMLNLTKAFLSVKGVRLGNTIEHHGLTLPLQKKEEIDIHSQKGGTIGIFQQFAKHLGCPVAEKTNVSLLTALGQIPELHMICYNLGYIEKQRFLPINIQFLTNENHNKLFVEVFFDKKHDDKMRTRKFLTGVRRDYFRDGYPRDGYHVYRCKTRKNFEHGSAERSYRKFLKEFQELGLASMLTRNGYYFYANLEPGSLHHLNYTLLAAYYVGTASRYRPEEMQDLMSGPKRPLISELIALCPKQFLYQILSLITQRMCVIPFSSL